MRVLVAAALAPTLVLPMVGGVAGCGSDGPQGPSTPATSTSDIGCATQVSVTEADNGSRFCLALGGTLTIQLHATGGAAWSAPQLTGDALRPAGAGTFTAVAAGTAEITASRPNCPSPSPGTAGCHSLLTFGIDVEVR
jgi:hypothetical protein